MHNDTFWTLPPSDLFALKINIINFLYSCSTEKVLHTYEMNEEVSFFSFFFNLQRLRKLDLEGRGQARCWKGGYGERHSPWLGPTTETLNLRKYLLFVGRQDWKRSVFIPIPKKDNAKECLNYHTIVLISHASKVILKILQGRLQQYVNQELPL